MSSFVWGDLTCGHLLILGFFDRLQIVWSVELSNGSVSISRDLQEMI